MTPIQAILVLGAFVDLHMVSGKAKVDLGVIRVDSGAELDLAAVADALRGGTQDNGGDQDGAERIHG